MIKLNSVTKSYGDMDAVRELSLSVETGGFTVLIGPSGCGKSTTLRMINRLVTMTSGNITIDGTDILSYRPEELRRRIGYAIQSVGLFPHMTVLENIILGVESTKNGVLKMGEAKKKVVELSEKYHLSVNPDALI